MARTPIVIVAVLALGLATAAWAGQPLETESTRLLHARQFEVEMGFEHQRAEDGSETAVPAAIGYGITNRFELLVEPVFYDHVRSLGRPSARGIGDLEATLTARMAEERGLRPALAVAFEAKLPTAQAPRLGTGRADLTLWGIASHRLGRCDVHADLGYTHVGRPAGVEVQDILNYGAAGELRMGTNWELVGEVFGASAALASAIANGENGNTPELGGSELVTAIGLRYLTAGWVPSLGVSVDKQGAILVHPGITRKF